MKASSSVRPWIIGAVLLALGAALALTAQRIWLRQAGEPAATTSAPAGTSYAPFTLRATRPAFSPEEETYAAGLWPIHSEVKDHAVKMTFAGLAYKLKESDAAAFKQKLAPVQTGFAQIAERLAKLQAPASMREHHRNYVSAMALYQAAVAEMLKAADDGAEQYLLSAQEKSQQAGVLLLKAGNTLWPTEYKPN
jgi:hypothetical protein